jgi:hypothetical protein
MRRLFRSFSAFLDSEVKLLLDDGALAAAVNEFDDAAFVVDGPDQVLRLGRLPITCTGDPELPMLEVDDLLPPARSSSKDKDAAFFALALFFLPPLERSDGVDRFRADIDPPAPTDDSEAIEPFDSAAPLHCIASIGCELEPPLSDENPSPIGLAGLGYDPSCGSSCQPSTGLPHPGGGGGMAVDRTGCCPEGDVLAIVVDPAVDRDDDCPAQLRWLPSLPPAEELDEVPWTKASMVLPMELEKTLIGLLFAMERLRCRPDVSCDELWDP